MISCVCAPLHSTHEKAQPLWSGAKAVFCRTAREITLKPRKDNLVTERMHRWATLLDYVIRVLTEVDFIEPR